MNNFLALDTASFHLTVLAAKGEKRSLRFTEDCALKHSVVLMGEIEKAMDEAGLTPCECDFFCAVTGPGSFTGIRIGISAAKGLALACGKPLMALTAFELIAYNVSGDKFIAVTDASHNHFYCCEFKDGQPVQPVYLQRDELIAYNLPLYGFQPLELPGYNRLNAGECLGNAVDRKLRAENSFGELHALYVRKSQAEEGRK